jgi:hypothetical protein
MFWFCSKIFRLNGKVLLLFTKFWNKSKRFGFVPNFLIKGKSSAFVLKILKHIKTFSFCFKVF